MAEKETNPPCHNPESEFRAVSLNRLKVISKDVEQRRTVLGKSWDELQIALSQYHASLVVRQEQFELQCDDSNTYITKLENELERRATENEHLQTRLDDVQEKCKALREENVVLRTAHEQVQNQVKIKENLIVKIQNQMSKESLEFSAEISALKESLDAMSETPRKRPRLDEVSIQKTDVSTKDAAQSDDAPPTFSIATMPHLALPTTSSEALETQNDVAYPSYDSASNLAPPEISHQVIQVPPLTQAKMKRKSVGSVKTGSRAKPTPRLEIVHTSLMTAHTCKVCGRSFGARYDLQRHERIHSGEKPYFCSGCNRRFARKDHLRLHMVRVHGIEEGTSLAQKESVEILIQGEDKDPLTVLREQQLAYQESLQGEVKLEPNDNYPLFPEHEAFTYKISSSKGSDVN